MQVLQRLDAHVRAVRTHRTLQCLHQVRQLHSSFLQVLHAHQFLAIEILHVSLQRLLSTQALHAKYQDQ
ncbi:hypothetical protein D3C76_1152150 [compost metagenome]